MTHASSFFLPLNHRRLFLPPLVICQACHPTCLILAPSMAPRPFGISNLLLILDAALWNHRFMNRIRSESKSSSNLDATFPPFTSPFLLCGAQLPTESVRRLRLQSQLDFFGLAVSSTCCVRALLSPPPLQFTSLSSSYRCPRGLSHKAVGEPPYLPPRADLRPPFSTR